MPIRQQLRFLLSGLIGFYPAPAGFNSLLTVEKPCTRWSEEDQVIRLVGNGTGAKVFRFSPRQVFART
jgi:hypothetical protein